MGVLDQRFEKNFMITSVDYVFNWARKSAIWPLTFGLACCAIEMIASTTSRFDMARFGAEVFRPSPRQADLMIVAGTVTLKMAPVLKRVWEQMPDPSGRTLLCAVEAPGQDRPDDSSEAANGSPPEATDGGGVQKGSDGGANAGAEIRSKLGKRSKGCKGKECRTASLGLTGLKFESGRHTSDSAGE